MEQHFSKVLGSSIAMLITYTLFLFHLPFLHQFSITFLSLFLPLPTILSLPYLLPGLVILTAFAFSLGVAYPLGKFTGGLCGKIATSICNFFSKDSQQIITAPTCPHMTPPAYHEAFKLPDVPATAPYYHASENGLAKNILKNTKSPLVFCNYTVITPESTPTDHILYPDLIPKFGLHKN